MQSEKEHCEHIKRRNPPNAKARNEVAVDVAPAYGVEPIVPVRRIDLAGGEMQYVKDDEEQEQCPAPTHRARSPGADLRGSLLVADGTRRASAHRQLVGHEHVQYDGDEQNDSDEPED